MKSAVQISAAVALLSGTSDAFWRMGCRGRTTLARIDPIVDKGTVSTHGHTVHGGNNFGMTTTYEDLRASDCGSCDFEDDLSAYWTPSLHFVRENGTVEIVPQVGGMLAYYQLNGNNLKAFPKDFEMIAGDTRLRNFTGLVPDPPLAAWTAEDKTQLALGQKSLGFNCLNDKRATEGSRYRHAMPDKEYLDANCLQGLRAELFFPSCWDGKNVKSDDHKSHMAYPDMIDGGECPTGFPVRTPSLFYETIWATNTFAGSENKGQFVWSNGDPTGYGYHGDFINGWDIPTLQAAVDDCTNLSGRVEDCKHFNQRLQQEDVQRECKVKPKNEPKILSSDNCEGPSEGLCGNVPIQYGPAYAEPLKAGDASKPVVPVLSSVAAPVIPSYAPARSVVNGVSVYNVKTDAPSVAAVPTLIAQKKPESKAPVSAPVVTPAPTPADPQDGGHIISTTTYTSDGVVYEVAIEEVAVYMTVTEDYQVKHRRHAHARAHMKKREHAYAH